MKNLEEIEEIENAGQYVQYLKFKYNTGYYSYEPRKDDSDYIVKVKERTDGIGDIGTLEERMIESLKKDVLEVLDEDEKRFIVNDIAFGIINSSTINASIFKSKYSKYAILFRTGLLIYLNKYFKYYIAINNPESVIYCDRKPHQLSKNDLIEYSEELIYNYKNYGRPEGAKIVLDQVALKEQGYVLMVSELFIMCHEIAHYINGDLGNKENYSLVNDDENQKRLFLKS